MSRVHGVLETAILCGVVVGCGGVAQHEPVTTAAPDGAALLERQAVILRAEDRREIGPELLDLVRNGDPRIRASAIQALGRIGGAPAKAPIAAALEDADAAVRARASFALGLLGARGAEVDTPLELGRDADGSVRASVATAFGLLGSERYSSQLATLLDDADPSVVAQACYAVPRFDQTGFAVEKLIELGGRKEPEVLFACTWALSELASDAERLDLRKRELARQRMIELTHAPQGWQRALAARGLNMPTREEEAASVGALIQDPDYNARIAAIGAITFPGAPLEPFMVQALKDTDERVYLATIQGLGRMRGDDIAEALATIVVHGERPWVREQAVVALGRSSNLAAQMANGLSRAPEPEIRRATAGVLPGRIDETTLEYARRLYNDADPSVRVAVIPAFAEAPAPLSESLAGVIESPDPETRSAVARAVARKLARSKAGDAGRADTVAVLETVWRLARESSDVASAVEVVHAASALGPDEAGRAILEQALAFPDWYVRRLAVSALARGNESRNGVDIAPAVDLPLEHYVEIARWASEPHAAIVTIERPGFAPGRFTVRLDAQAAPLGAWRFAQLAQAGLYDNRTIEDVVSGFAVHASVSPKRSPDAPAGTLRDEIRATQFFPGTLGFSSPGPDGGDGSWFVTLVARPELMTRHTAFGQVVQNFSGVVTRLVPGDRVVSVEIYAGDGSEPLPAAP
jgi:cyclophilin family peptidyl-prolyl cis-trans isomerase/HEAT repeat protein